MNDFLGRVQDGLSELRRLDPDGRKVFGAHSHRYLLEPALPEASLQRFEKKHAIELPADYRAFLGKLGNGGAGPCYGVFKLGEMDHGHGFKRWNSGEFVGTLATPFPHRKAWNLAAEELSRMQESEDDDELVRVYWGAVDGAIPICHEGCALRDWLVVTGPESGRVWHDATADFEGWSPITSPDEHHLTFAEWYLAWLERALAAARGPRSRA